MAPFIHVNFLRELYSASEMDFAAKTVEAHNQFGLDIIRCNCTPTYNDVLLSSNNWRVTRWVEKQNGNETVNTTISTPEGELREVFRVVWTCPHDTEMSPIEHFIKSQSDFEKFVKYQPPVGQVDTTPIVRAKELVGQDGIVSPWVQGAFNYLTFLYRRLDDVLVDALTDPNLYQQMMSYFVRRNKVIITQFIDAGVDALCYAGNVASAKVVDEKFFRKYIFPYEKELIDYIQSCSVPVFYHNCGYAKNLLSPLSELGMRGYESLTGPPFGDTVLDEALAVFSHKTTLSGNIDQIEFLRKAQPQDVRNQVREVLEKAKKRGNFILGTTDYFHEGTPHENIYALCEAGREFGKY